MTGKRWTRAMPLIAAAILACVACAASASVSAGRKQLFPRPALSADAENQVLTVEITSLEAMKSPWGTTVRSYGGTHVGFHVAENENAPPRKGPFAGKEIRLQLSDFHAARGGPSAQQLIPDLIEHGMTAIYLMTNIVRPSKELFDNDRVYRAVWLIHEAYPEAHRHIVWQIGNEVVSGHFDPKGVWAAMPPQEKQQNGMKEDNFFGYDLQWKEEYYVNDYLATGKVKGIWITEDHGRAGRGPVTILDRGLRFLAWAAKNHLSAEQTRLCWWGERERDPGGAGAEVAALIGQFFASRRLYFCSQSVTAVDHRSDSVLGHDTGREIHSRMGDREGRSADCCESRYHRAGPADADLQPVVSNHTT